MTSFHNFYRTNKGLEAVTGVELHFGHGLSVTVKRAGGANHAFGQRWAERMQALEQEFADRPIDEASMRAAQIEVFVDTVIINWKGMTDEAGKALDFTEENLRSVLELMPDLFYAIRDEAHDFTTFMTQHQPIMVEIPKR